MANLIEEYLALDPNGDYFNDLKKSPKGVVQAQQIQWSTEFNQAVREVPVCGIGFERLLGARPDVPLIDVNFFPMASDIDPIRCGITTKANIALSGPAGTGKSSVVEQLAARLNRPFYCYDVNEDSRPETLIGQFLPVDGNKLKWADGPVTRALRNVGSFFLLDEANMASGSILACMHRVLASRETTLHENNGEVVRSQPGVMFFMACNALNDANMATAYSDIKPMNRAFLDRFGIVVRTGYPSQNQEVQIIMKRIKESFPDSYQKLHKTGLKNIVTKMVQIAGGIRKGIEAGDMNISFSLRRTMNWAKTFAYYEELKRATWYGVLNLEEPSTAKTIDTMVHSEFGDQYTRKFKD